MARIVPNTARTTIALRPRPSVGVQNRVRAKLKESRTLRRKTLKAYIKERGLTLTAISRQTGIDLSYVSRIISGSRMPGLDTTMRLARCLDMGLDELAALLIPDLDIVHKAEADADSRQ